ncbi:MAG: hypothetical protein ACO363_06305, partial [Balneolaceae bacterium]
LCPILGFTGPVDVGLVGVRLDARLAHRKPVHGKPVHAKPFCTPGRGADPSTRIKTDVDTWQRKNKL